MHPSYIVYCAKSCMCVVQRFLFLKINLVNSAINVNCWPFKSHNVGVHKLVKQMDTDSSKMKTELTWSPCM